MLDLASELKPHVSQPLWLTLIWTVGFTTGSIWLVSRVLHYYREAKGWVASVSRTANAEAISEAIHKTLNNGIRAVVREETAKVVDAGIAKHEVAEQTRLYNAIDGVRQEIAELRRRRSRTQVGSRRRTDRPRATLVA